MVTFVEKNSPADKAGLKAGDVIVSLDSQKMSNTEQLRKDIQSHKVGDIVNITFERDRNELVASVTLEESPVPR